MSAAEAAVAESLVQTVLRYGYAIDIDDHQLLRSVFTSDAELLLPGRDPVRGADAIVETIVAATADRLWQQHLIAVTATHLSSATAASAYSNVISHKTLRATPDVVVQLCGTYADELLLLDGSWRIHRKEMAVGWTEERSRVS